MYILSKISGIILAAAMSLNIISTPVQAPVMLGADIPNTPALYDGYLASGILKTDTSMTLSTGLLRNNQPLTGYTCFVIDVNQPTVEYVCGTASSTSVTNIMRGVDVLNPTASSSALAYGHRRFASVSISDYPTIQLLVQRVNTIIASGTANYVTADEGHIGFVQLASNNQIASSTSIGSTNARLAIGSNLATSTYNAGASYVIPVTGATNKIDGNFISVIPTLTTTGTTILATTTTIGQTYAFDIGKHIWATTTTASTTFTVPNGIRTIIVEGVGGGGAGANVGDGAGAVAGGGAGGYFRKVLDVSGTTTVAVRVGSGGVAGGSGTSTIVLIQGTTLIANPGTGGGAGGTATGGDINITGGDGSLGATDRFSTSAINAYAGTGGSSYFGGGGKGGVGGSAPSGAVGSNASAYGAGGGGAASGHDNGSGGGGAYNGGSGQTGIVIITY